MDANKKDQIIKELQEKIKSHCEISKYKYLSNRIANPSGLAFVVNRCISMMSEQKIKLSSVLAILEEEFETNN